MTKENEYKDITLEVDVRIPGELKYQYYEAKNVPVSVRVNTELMDNDYSITPEGLRVVTDQIMEALSKEEEYDEEDIEEGW